MIDLTELTIDGMERKDNGTIGAHASFETPDGLRVGIFDVTDTDNGNAAWVRVFEDRMCHDLLLDGHLKESVCDGNEDVAQFARDAVVSARIAELEQTPTQAAF